MCFFHELHFSFLYLYLREKKVSTHLVLYEKLRRENDLTFFFCSSLKEIIYRMSILNKNLIYLSEFSTKKEKINTLLFK